MRFEAFILVVIAGIAPAQACEPSPTETKTPATSAAPQPDLAADATRLLQETAASLQDRTIAAAEEPAFLALLATAEQLKTAKSPAPSERERLRALARVRLRQAAEVLAKQAARKPAAGKGTATIQAPATTTLAQQLPGVGAGAGATGNAAVRESAEELMEVITGSIQPESWEDVGGRGVIRYFAIGHALVITATSDIHNGVGDLIEQLR